MVRVQLRDDVVDWAMALAVAVGAVLQQRGAARIDPLWLNVGVVLLATLPIGLRRRRPFPMLMLVGFASVAHVMLGFTNTFLVTFAALIALFSIASYAPWALSVLAAAFTASLLPVVMLVDWTNQGTAWLSDIPYNYALFGAAWVLGDNLRREREHVQVAMQLRAEEEERSRRAVGEERSRIARELHDVIAHTLSVIVLQAGAGRRLTNDQPERAGGILTAIETLGREALGDMRRLVGILRTDAETGTETEPQPGLATVPELARRVSAAGLSVDVRVEGEPRSLPSGVELSAYRIVQEALTNALRHAGAARAVVVVRYGGAGVEVEITDDGRGPAPASGAGGHGLVGMRERVGIFGGELEIGAREGGGFRVRALLPA